MTRKSFAGLSTPAYSWLSSATAGLLVKKLDFNGQEMWHSFE